MRWTLPLLGALCLLLWGCGEHEKARPEEQVQVDRTYGIAYLTQELPHDVVAYFTEVRRRYDLEHPIRIGGQHHEVPRDAVASVVDVLGIVKEELGLASCTSCEVVRQSPSAITVRAPPHVQSLVADALEGAKEYKRNYLEWYDHDKYALGKWRDGK